MAKKTSKKYPFVNEAFFGQDAQYQGKSPSYTKNINGTVLDNITRLVWSQTIDINNDGKIITADKLTYTQAINYVKKLALTGHSDWRLPNIKELYSLTLFDGQDPSGKKLKQGKSPLIPFIDHSVSPLVKLNQANDLLIASLLARQNMFQQPCTKMKPFLVLTLLMVG